MPLTQFGSEG